MSNMEEISYWVYTKRAPCLFNYDNIINQQSEQAQCSNTKAPSAIGKEEEPSPKRMRTLKLLEEDSMSTEKQQNVYFKAPQIQKPTASSPKSEEASSDVDFNIKASKALKKSKNLRSQKNCPTRVPKKIKVSTSTPKVVNLRRSLRNANNSHLNSSFEIFNDSIVNGKPDVGEEAEPDRANDEQNKSKVILPKKQTNEVVPNGQFEDLSDVSGFTANYIRSTKILSSKRPPKLRNQNSRTITRQSKQTDKIILCVDKSVNTGFPDTAALNCSNDSSQNALKLVTVKNIEQSARVNKSTSLLKFMETNLEGSHSLSKTNKRESKNNLTISFQSRSSGVSRHPRRQNNNTETPEPNCTTTVVNTNNRRYNMRKGTLNMNRKENSEEKLVSRTRSGKRRGLQLDVETPCAVLQLNSSTEPVSSSPALNVAGPNTRSAKTNASTRCLRSRTLRDKVVHLYKESSSEGSDKKNSDGMHCALEQSTPKCVKKVKKTVDRPGQSLGSLRDKSGFAACFSDSDSDSAPLNQRKFFC